MRLATAVILTLTFSQGTSAQTHVRGRVTVTTSAATITGVRVLFRDSASSRTFGVVSDSLGEFDISIPNDILPAKFFVRSDMIGFASVEDVAVNVKALDDLFVVVELDEEAIPVRPLKVLASRAPSHYLDEFNRRARDVQHGSGGTIISRADLIRGGQQSVARVLGGTPGMRYIRDRTGDMESVLSTRGNCAPKVYLDGTPTVVSNVAMISAESLEGAEIYVGPSQGPAEYFDPKGCGVILLWSRRGEAAGDRHYPIIGLGIIASITAILLAK